MWFRKGCKPCLRISGLAQDEKFLDILSESLYFSSRPFNSFRILGLFLFFLIFFNLTLWHVGSWFPDKGSNLYPAWKVWHLNHWDQKPRILGLLSCKVSLPKLFGAWALPAAPSSLCLASEVIVMHVVMLLCAVRVAVGGSVVI